MQDGTHSADGVFFIFQVRKKFCSRESIIFSSFVNLKVLQIRNCINMQGTKSGQLVSWSVFFFIVAIYSAFFWKDALKETPDDESLQQRLDDLMKQA